MMTTYWHLKQQHKYYARINQNQTMQKEDLELSLFAITARKNLDSMASSITNSKLKPTIIQVAVDRMQIGDSPLKQDRPKKIPLQFTMALAVHSIMMQIAAMVRHPELI